MLNLGLMEIRLDSASNKIKDLRDPEIPPSAGFGVTNQEFL
jgi:hypothetical protein